MADFSDVGRARQADQRRAHHLVENAIAFGSKRDRRNFRRNLGARLMSGGHAGLFRNDCVCKCLLYAVPREAENASVDSRLRHCYFAR